MLQLNLIPIFLQCTEVAIFWLMSGPTISPWAKTFQPPIFVNKVLLEHSHVYSFTNCLRLLSGYSKVEQSQRDCLIKPKILTICPLQKKVANSSTRWKRKLFEKGFLFFTDLETNNLPSIQDLGNVKFSSNNRKLVIFH